MAVTATILRTAGYRVSAQVTEAEVTLASNDVENAYVRRIYDYDRPGSVVLDAVCCLTYILLLQRRAVATRSGGKEKLSPSLSSDAGPTQQDFEKADMLLRKVQQDFPEDAVQGHPSTIVEDICGIYYRKKYIGL